MSSKNAFESMIEDVKKIWKYNNPPKRDVSKFEKLKSKEDGIFMLLFAVVLLLLLLLFTTQAPRYLYNYRKAKVGFDIADKKMKSEDEICLDSALRKVIKPYWINSSQHRLEKEKCIFIGHLEGKPIYTTQAIDTPDYLSIDPSALSFFSNKNTTLVSTNGQKIKLWDISSKYEASSSIFSRDSRIENIQAIDRYTQQYRSLVISDKSDESLKLKLEELYVEPSMLDKNSSSIDVKSADSSEGSSSTEDDKQKDFTEVAFAPNGRTVAIAMKDGTLALWDLQDPIELEKNPSKPETSGTSPKVVLISPQDGSGKTKQNIDIIALAFSHDGTFLASGSMDGTINLWKVDSNNPAPIISSVNVNGPHRVINALVFSPKENILAVGTSVSSSNKDLADDQGVLQIWQIEDGELSKVKDLSIAKDESINKTENQEIKFKGFDVRSLDFSADGQFLASGIAETTEIWTEPEQSFNSGYYGYVYLWQINLKDDSFKMIQSSSPIEHGDWVNTVKFSPNGQILASGSYDGSIKLWDVTALYPKKWWEIVNKNNSDSENKEIPHLTTLEDSYRYYEYDLDPYLLGSIRSVSFSPDGKTLASMSADNTVKIWRLH